MTRASLSFLAILSLAVLAEEPRRLVVEGEVEASPAEVWRLFTTVEGVTTWMVPVAEVDLRIGGHLRTNYDPKQQLGDPGTITNRILAFDPERMLTIQVAGAPEGFPHAEAVAQVWTVIYFEPVEGGKKTRLRIVGLGWPAGEKGDAAYEFFKAGNAHTLKRVQERAKTGKPLGWERSQR